MIFQERETPEEKVLTLNQDTKVHESINSFPLEENGYPDCENPAPILPYSTGTFIALDNLDLLQLIRGLQDRCDRQESEISALRDKIDSLEKQQIIDLGRVYDYISQRTKKPEPSTTEKTQPHLDKLAGYLGEKRKRGIPALMGFKEAAQVTGLTKQRISQLRQSIEADGRFTIQSRGKKLYIGLRY